MYLILTIALDTFASAALIFFAAVGLTLIFSVLRVLNVAHGSFFAIGAYVTAVLLAMQVKLDLNPYWSYLSIAISSILVAATLGPIIERTIIRRSYGQSEAFQIIITFGLFLILEDLQRIIFGVKSFYNDAPVRALGTVEIGGVSFLVYQLALAVVGIGVVYFLRWGLKATRYGKLVSTIVFDRELAQTLGVRVHRIFMGAFTFGIFLAALGGGLALPTSGVAPGLGADTTVLAFAVIVIGGLGAVEGAAIAAFIVALARVLAVYFAPELDAVAPYAVMLVVLIVRPYGLFTVVEARKI